MMPVDRFAFPLAFEIIVDCIYGTRLGLLDQKTATRHHFIDKTIKMFQLSMPCMFNRSWDGGNPATPELQAWLDAMEDLYAEGLKQMAGVHDSADTSSIFAFLRDNGNFSEDELNVNSLVLLIAGVDTTSNSMGWLLHWLATLPDVQVQVHSELREVLQGSTATAQDFPRLKYLRYCMEE